MRAAARATMRDRHELARIEPAGYDAPHGPMQVRLLQNSIRANVRMYVGLLLQMMDTGYYTSAGPAMREALCRLRRQLDPATCELCLEDFCSAIADIARDVRCQEPPMLALPLATRRKMLSLEHSRPAAYDTLALSSMRALLPHGSGPRLRV